MLAVYIPPSTNVAEFQALAEALAVELAAIKSSVKDPAIFIGGDMNRRDLCPHLTAVDNFGTVDSPPTRGNAALDKMLTNAGCLTRVVNVLPPLETPGGLKSDHGVVYAEAEFPCAKNFRWVVKWRRTRNKEREDAFARDLDQWDWSALDETGDPTAMTSHLEDVISALTEKHFPLTRVRKRSNEDPWISRKIRRLWKKKIRLYKKGENVTGGMRLIECCSLKLKMLRLTLLTSSSKKVDPGGPFTAQRRSSLLRRPHQRGRSMICSLGLMPVQFVTRSLTTSGALRVPVPAPSLRKASKRVDCHISLWTGRPAS